MNMEAAPLSQMHVDHPTEYAQALFYIDIFCMHEVPNSEILIIPHLSLAVNIDYAVGPAPGVLLRRTPSGLWKLDDIMDVPLTMKTVTLRLTFKDAGQEITLAHATLTQEGLPPPEGERVAIDFKLARSYPKLRRIVGIVAFCKPGESERVSAIVEDFQSRMDDKDFMLLQATTSPTLHPDQLGALLYLGSHFLINFIDTKDKQNIKKSISAFKKAVSLVSPEDSNFVEIMKNLADPYIADWNFFDNFDSLNCAISALNVALEHIHSDAEDKALLQQNLAECFAQRFYCTYQDSDLNRAIILNEEILANIPDNHPKKSTSFNYVAVLLFVRFKRTGDLTYCDRAVLADKDAIQLAIAGSTNIPKFFWHIGSLFQARFEITGDICDIDEALLAYKEALSIITAREDGLRNFSVEFYDITGLMEELSSPKILHDLGSSLLSRFSSFGNMGDINMAIDTFREGIRFTDDDAPILLSEQLAWLGNALKFRFERTGTTSDIEDALSAIRNSFDKFTPDSDYDVRSLFRVDILGNILLRRFLAFGDANDLNDSIMAFENAVKFTPEETKEARRGARLSHLGNALLRRFEVFGNESDIDQAISAQQNAIRLTSDSDRGAHINYNNSGNAFLRRYEFRNNRKDLEEAVVAFRKTAQLCGSNSPDLPQFLDNLSTSLRIRGKLDKSTGDLDEAISIQQQASSLLPPGHAKTGELLANCGRIYLERFDFSNDLNDLNEAISAQNKSLDILPRHHVAKSMVLEYQADAYVELFNMEHDLKVVDFAITLYRESIDSTPTGHPQLVSKQLRLARAFKLRFQYNGGIVENREAALTAYHLAASDTHGIPLQRLYAAHEMALFCLEFDPPRSLEGYRYSLELLQRVAWLGASISERHETLRKISYIPIEAATVALTLGEKNIALEWLEYGRCVVWSQLNNLRTPLDHLRDVYPEFADELMRISVFLDKSSIQVNEWSYDDTMGTKISIQEESRTRHQLANQWDKLLERVRAMEGFEDFLRAPKFSQLLDLGTKSGPVVVINMHPSRCDALVLKSATAGCVHVTLERFSYQRANFLREALASCLGTHGLRTREVRTGRRALDQRTRNVEEFSKILAELWIGVAKPILEVLSYSPSENPSRLWWCLTGPLAFLPIHAAGIYQDNVPFGSKVSDYVVSSYTPSISALVAGRQRKKGKEFGGILAVSQPNAPHLAPIPNTTKEVEAIHHEFGQAGLPFELLEGNAATVESVLGLMETRNWIHFACHALQNVYEPTKSAFYLYDGPLELSTLIRKPLPSADFAFLSACQTGTGDYKLSEEAVHLAAGMMSAGYRSVIATMWSINDEHCPIITREIYSQLLSNTEHSPDSGKAAHALHDAVQHLRRRLGDSEDALLSWVPFVHIGV